MCAHTDLELTHLPTRVAPRSTVTDFKTITSVCLEASNLFDWKKEAQWLQFQKGKIKITYQNNEIDATVLATK